MGHFTDIDGSAFTLKAKWNPNTKKNYVEILKDGKHYAYAPLSIFSKNQKSFINQGIMD